MHAYRSILVPDFEEVNDINEDLDIPNERCHLLSAEGSIASTLSSRQDSITTQKTSDSKSEYQRDPKRERCFSERAIRPRPQSQFISSSSGRRKSDALKKSHSLDSPPVSRHKMEDALPGGSRYTTEEYHQTETKCPSIQRQKTLERMESLESDIDQRPPLITVSSKFRLRAFNYFYRSLT